MSLAPGIYTISNAYYPIVVDLQGGSAKNGTPVRAWAQHAYTDPQCCNQLWLVEPTQDTNTYTVRNLKSGTYLDLNGGSPLRGAKVIGWQRTGSNQEWQIDKPNGSIHYKLQNKMSNTFLDLLNGGSKDGTAIVGWPGIWTDKGPSDHQIWNFQRVGYTGGEIETMIASNPYIDGSLECYAVDRIYWVLDPGLLRHIWDGADLGNGRRYTYRAEIFDCDDFAVAFKDTVAKWGTDNLLADGFGLLCGIMLGTSNVAGQPGHAYNFTLTDYSPSPDVLFFEPQTGASMSNIGYNAFLAFY